MTNFQKSLAILIEKQNYPELIQQLLHVIIDSPDGTLDVLARNTILQMRGIRRISDIKTYTLDVIINYAQLCLEDGVLTNEEIKNVHLLKLFLGIEEGDFFRNNKKNEVENILTKQLSLLYADGKIDQKEALLMSDMQGLFGLSYMEYEEFIAKVANQ